MSREFVATRLDVQAFAQAAATLSDAAPLARYPRLAEESAAAPLAEDADQVRWSVQGEWRGRTGDPGSAWLHLEASARLTQTCQRCLTPVQTALEVVRSFRFVADEATASAEDEAAEEDLLVLSRHFDLTELVEDELLMALPVVPRHEQCPAPVRLAVQDPDFDAAEAARPNPFAALARLRPGVSED